jgi:hypothetical protein
MANTTLQIKKSGVTGNVPSSLEYGELALNYADGKLYYRDSNNTITFIQSGSTTDSFATINANSSLIFATSPTDTLSIAAGNNITISACTISKTITINAQDSDVDQFARNTANDAYTQANIATDLAQSAFDKANTGGAGGSLEIVNDNSSNNVYYINFTNTTSGNANTIYVSSENLTFNPNTGILNVKSLDITANSNISSKSYNATGTGQVTIDSFSKLIYRSAFYQLQIESGLSYNILNLNILQSGSNTFTSVFGEVYSVSSLGSFSSDILGDNVRLLFTPAVDNTTVTFIRNAIAQSANVPDVPSADLGFVGEPVTIIFDAGFDSQEVTDAFDYGSVA